MLKSGTLLYSHTSDTAPWLKGILKSGILYMATLRRSYQVYWNLVSLKINVPGPGGECLSLEVFRVAKNMIWLCDYSWFHETLAAPVARLVGNLAISFPEPAILGKDRRLGERDWEFGNYKLCYYSQTPRHFKVTRNLSTCIAQSRDPDGVPDISEF
jgi:hypothetical protein